MISARIVHKTLGAAAAGLVFSATFAASVVAHGDLPATRRFVAQLSSRILGDIFLGKIVVDRIDHIGFDGVDVAAAHVLDPTGRRVINARGVHGRFSLLGLARSLLSPGPGISLTFADIDVDDAEVVLDTLPSGSMRLEETFRPKPPKVPPKPPKPPLKPKAPLVVLLPDIHVEHVWAHGEPSPGVLIDAEGSNARGAVRVDSRTGVGVDVERFGLTSRFLPPLNPTGTAEYHLRITAEGDPTMWSSFNGNLGSAPATVSAQLHGLELDATLDAPRIQPDELRSLIAGSTLREGLSLHATAKGPVSTLRIEARAVSGPSEIDLAGNLDLTNGVSATADVRARDVDPQLFSESAPSVALGGDANVRVRIDTGGLSAETEATTFPFTLGGQSVPGARVKAKYAGGVAEGTADVYEPGTTTSGSFRAERGALSVDVTSDVPSLAAVPRLGRAIEGGARIKAQGKLSGGIMDVHVDADLRNVGKGATRVGSGKLRGRLSGKTDAPVLDARLDGAGFHVAGTTVERGIAEAHGPLRAPHLTLDLRDSRWSELKLAADLTPEKIVHFSKVSATFAKADVRTSAVVGSLDIAGERITLRKIDVKSDAGTLAGEATVAGGSVALDLDGKLDLEKLSRNVPFINASHGVARVAVHIKTDGRRRKGDVRLEVEDAEIFLLPLRIDAAADVHLDDETVATKLSASVSSREGPVLATLDASGEGKVPGTLFQAASWGKATGSARVQKIAIDLDHLFHNPLVEAALTQVPGAPKLGGQVLLSGTMERELPSGTPNVTAAMETLGLSVSLPPASPGGLPREWRGFDLLFSGSATRQKAEDGGRGGADETMRLDLAGRFSDAQRPFAVAAVRSTIHPADVLRDLATLFRGGADAEGARDRLAALPLVARGSLVERKLSEWPEPIRLKVIDGVVSVSADITGSLAEPAGSFTVRAGGLQATAQGIDPWPIDGAFSGRFHGNSAEFVASLMHGGEQVAEIGLSGDVRLADLLWRRPGAETWKGNALVRLSGFHLQSIPIVAASGFSGNVTGQIKATGLHDRPRFEIDLGLDHGKLFDAPLKHAAVAGWLTEGAGVLTASIEQAPRSSSNTSGKLLVTAFPGVKFKDGLVPALDPTRAQTIAVQAQRFDIEPLSPFTAPLLADLGGYVDGEATLTVQAPTADGHHPTNLWGAARWNDGVVLIPQLGQTFSRGKMAVRTESRQGSVYVIARDLSLDASTGRVGGWANVSIPTHEIIAALYGKHEEEHVPITAEAGLTIASGEKIPITFEGVALGDAYGRVEGQLAADEEGILIDVGIPELVFQLPESEKRDVQDLAPHADVGVIDRIYREGKKPGPQRTRIVVRVGVAATLGETRNESPSNTGRVTVERGGLEVALQGRPVLEFTDQLRMTGTVETLSGRVLALGKPFVIERGLIRFDGEHPENPYVSLRAAWDAPDGTRVYAELVGYLEEAKLRLRSEPPRSEADVLGLVLFGRTGADAGVPGQTDSRGVAAGTGVASSVLNSLLDPKLFGRRIETRVDTTNSRGTAVGVATEVRPNLWAQVDVSTARQRERTNQDVSAVTLDWRFRRNWSVRTTVGDRGTSILEVLWQYRY
jgi:translocation and assembly module TamB